MTTQQVGEVDERPNRAHRRATEFGRVPLADEHPTLTIDEARPFLGLGRSAAYAAAATGELPTIRIGRRVMVPTAALRRLLQLDEG